MGFLEQIIPAKQALDKWLVYLYGEPGCGKTVLACRASLPLYIQIDRNGRRSLKNHADLLGIPTLDATDSREILERILGEVKRNPGGEYDRFSTLVIDSWSRLQELDRERIEKGLGANRQGLSEHEYKINNSNMKKILHLLHDIGKNVILVSHQTEVRDDEGKTVLIRPRNSEVVVGDIFAQSDAMFYMTSSTNLKGETTRKLRTLASGRTQGKSRFQLPVEVIDPDENFWKLLD